MVPFPRRPPHSFYQATRLPSLRTRPRFSALPRVSASAGAQLLLVETDPLAAFGVQRLASPPGNRRQLVRRPLNPLACRIQVIGDIAQQGAVGGLAGKPGKAPF